MNEKKRISEEEWINYTDALINSNRNKTVSVAIKPEGKESETLFENLPLLDVVLDPVGKGDAITVRVGEDKNDFTHIINSPIDIFEVFHPKNGALMAVEFTNKSFDIVTLTFKE
jgi:hypothetical protein